MIRLKTILPIVWVICASAVWAPSILAASVVSTLTITTQTWPKEYQILAQPRAKGNATYDKDSVVAKDSSTNILGTLNYKNELPERIKIPPATTNQKVVCTITTHELANDDCFYLYLRDDQGHLLRCTLRMKSSGLQVDGVDGAVWDDGNESFKMNTIAPGDLAKLKKNVIFSGSTIQLQGGIFY